MTEGFLEKMKDVISGDSEQKQQSEAGNQTQGQFGDVRPASEDPYGDPADQTGGGQFGDVRPASEDPYGDPADQNNA